MDNKIPENTKTTSSNGSIQISNSKNNQEKYYKVVTGSPYGDKVKQDDYELDKYISQEITLALREEYQKSFNKNDQNIQNKTTDKKDKT